MPIHEFVCDKCDKIQEDIYMTSEQVPQQKVCSCDKGGTLRRIFSASSIHLDGSFPSARLRKERNT